MYISVFGEFANEKVEKFYRERLNQLTIEERWRIIAGMRQIMVDTVCNTIRAEHPDWDRTDINLEATRRIMLAHGTVFKFDRVIK